MRTAERELALLNREAQPRLDYLGTMLNQKLNCPVKLDTRVPKPAFVCTCGVVFPVFAVDGAVQYDNWSTILSRHKLGNSFDGGVDDRS